MTLACDRKTTTGLKYLPSGVLVSVSVLLLLWVPPLLGPQLQGLSCASVSLRRALCVPPPPLGWEVRSARPELQHLAQLICSGHSPPEG